MEPMEELRKSLKEDKLVFGTEQTIKSIKTGRIKKVFLSVNCPETVKKDLTHYGELSKSDIFQLDIPNTELGVLCKKPFSVSILGALK